MVSSEKSQGDFHGRRWFVMFWGASIVVAVVHLLIPLFQHTRPDQFIFLARSFSYGRLDVDDMPLIFPDYVLWQGHTYLPPGPFPAILLIPLLPLIDAGLQPGWVSVFFTTANALLLSQILRRIAVAEDNRKWTLLLFFGGTVYFGVAITIISWYLAHIITTFCLLLAIYEALTKNRPLFVGLVLGLAAMTRLSAIFSLPFFLWMTVDAQTSTSSRDRITKLSKLALGLFFPLILLFAYNYARFGTVLETGYGIDVVGSNIYEQARSHGLFSLVHIPKNLFVLLLQGPLPYPSLDSPILEFPYLQPSPWGMGVLIASPALVYAFVATLNDRLVKACWLGIGFVLIPLLTHYATGWVQFGYRYSLDFMPFLILVSARGFRTPASQLMRVLIVTSVLVNLWGTFWLVRWN